MGGQHLLPQQQIDDQRALVEQLTGTVQTDHAQIENAKLQLDYARIKSPIDGVTGVRLVDQGNIVHAADATGIVVVTQMDPIAVLFTLPQDDLPDVAHAAGRGSRCRSRRAAATARSCSAPGQLELIDNQINQATATMRLKAIFPNPNRALWPNQFVKARLRLTVRKGALVIPAVAVQRGPQGTFVYVAKRRARPSCARSAIERIEGEDALIAKGLAPGEQGRARRAEPAATGRQARLREAARPRAAGADHARPGRPADRRRQPRHVNVSEPFIRRPVGTSLLMIGVVVAGVAAYQQLPVSALPQVDYPTIVVSTILPGASADTMVSAVTTPLERQLGQIPSLAHLTSVTSAASSQITLQFDLDRDIDSAEQDVQAAINAASNLLPRTLPTPPTYSKSNPADVPVISLGRHARTRRRCRASTTTPTRSWRRSCRRSRAWAW